MKIKNLLLSVLLFPLSLFAATNSFDNITVSTSLKNNGTFFSTNSAITNKMVTTLFYPRGPTGESIQFSDSQGNIIGNIVTNAFQGFAIQTTNNGPRISFRASSGLIMISNANFEVTGNSLLDGNVTFGDQAADSITWNASTSTMIGGHNFNSSTMFITNGTVSFGTNATSLTAAVLIQGLVTNGAGFIVRGTPSPNLTSEIQQWQTANGTSVAGVFSNGVIHAGLGTFQATGINAINNGGTVSFINNSAATDSIVNLGAGTGTTALAKISASGFTGLITIGTNLTAISSANVKIGTNGTVFSSIISVSGNVIPGSIAANATYTTNFTLANAVTNGSYMQIKPPLFENINLGYQVGCPSNGFVTIYIHNFDLVSAHTATSGVYGATGIMP